MLDMLVRNATLPDGRKGLDIAIQNGKIVEVAQSIQTQAKQEIDAQGFLVNVKCFSDVSDGSFNRISL